MSHIFDCPLQRVFRLLLAARLAEAKDFSPLPSGKAQQELVGGSPSASRDRAAAGRDGAVPEPPL